MSPHTHGARLSRWHSNLCGTWLIKINNTTVSSIPEAQLIFKSLHDTHAKQYTLLFAHPEINCDISNSGLPIINPTEFTQLTLEHLNSSESKLSPRGTRSH